MKVEEELIGFSPEKDTVLTVGVFDGVHLGHKRLITELLCKAAKGNYLAGVVTFRQHPEDLLSKNTKLPFLTDMQTRTRLAKRNQLNVMDTPPSCCLTRTRVCALVPDCGPAHAEENS